MTNIDWSIVVFYVFAAIGIGLWFRRKASSSATEYFVAGRSLPWFIAGTSMVASTFSSDTPLFVAGLVRDKGIYANWIWWGGMGASMVSVFFFARLWRRSKAITEVEFVAQRYRPGVSTTFLRAFRAVFDGVLVNTIVMASVTLAMSKVIVAILGLSSEPVMSLPLIGDMTPTFLLTAGLALAAVAYTAVSGLYGVVYTDLIQFTFAMVGAIALAVIAWLDLSANGGFVASVKAAPGFNDEMLQLFPVFGWNLETLTFLVFIFVLPLSNVTGPGYFLQRLLAAKSERDAVLSVAWYSVCNYVLRSWPWITVAIASIVYFPILANGEDAYPLMINEVLPAGLKGIMVASLLAAFMSTLDTHLNWGSSYLVNDVYQPLIAQHKSQRHYVMVARVSMIVLAFIALIVATKLTSILQAYTYLGVMITGPAVVLILRWYWWRINVWTELAALLSSLIFGNSLLWLVPDSPEQSLFAIRVLLNVFVTTGIALVVTVLTSKNGPDKQTIAFYKRIRTAGRGWRRVQALTGVETYDDSLARTAIACMAAVFSLAGLMFLVGGLILERPELAAASAVVTVVAFLIMRRFVGGTFRDGQQSE